MATLNLTYDTGTVTLARIQDAFAVQYHYQTTIPDPANPGQTIPNPETKAQFARRIVRQFIVDVVHSAEKQAAVTTAAAGVTKPTFVD